MLKYLDDVKDPKKSIYIRKYNIKIYQLLGKTHFMYAVQFE